MQLQVRNVCSSQIAVASSCIAAQESGRLHILSCSRHARQHQKNMSPPVHVLVCHRSSGRHESPVTAAAACT
jgi:hypothetical protein